MNDTYSLVKLYSQLLNKWELSTGSSVVLVVINIILTILSHVVNTPMVYILLTKKKFRTTENFIAGNLFVAGVVGSLLPPLFVSRLLCKSCQNNTTFRAVIVMIMVVHSAYTVLSVLLIAVHRARNIHKLRTIREELTLRKRFLIVFLPAFLAIVSPLILPVVFVLQSYSSWRLFVYIYRFRHF